MTIGTYDEIADKLLDRFGRVVTDIEFSIAPKTEAERELLADMARTIQADAGGRARRAILGQAA